MKKTILSFVSLLFLSSCSTERSDQMVSIDLHVFINVCKNKLVTMSSSNQNTEIDMTIEKATLLYNQNHYLIRSPSLDFRRKFYPILHHSFPEKKCFTFQLGYLDRSFIVSPDNKDFWKMIPHPGKLLLEFNINGAIVKKPAYFKDFLQGTTKRVLKIDLDSP